MLRRSARSGVAVALASLLLVGCTGEPAPTATSRHTVPPRPDPLTSEQVRTVDACGLISAYALQRVFFHDGPGDLQVGIAADVSGCEIFVPEAGVELSTPTYRISLTDWPTAEQWPEVTGGERTSREGGGWLVVGPPSDAQEVFGYTARGFGYRVLALKPAPGDLDVRRERAIMSMLLQEASRGSLPTIPWTGGNLLSRDICAAAKTAGLAQTLGLTDPKSRPVVAASPDARACAEKATGSNDSRFQVSAGLVGGLDTGGGAEAETIAGHAAVQKQDGPICRVTIEFPGDQALETRFTEGGARTTALTVIAQRPCAEVVAAAGPLVEELDRAA